MNRNRYTRKQRKSWATSACAAPEVVSPSLSQAASPLYPPKRALCLIRTKNKNWHMIESHARRSRRGPGLLLPPVGPPRSRGYNTLRKHNISKLTPSEAPSPSSLPPLPSYPGL